MKHKKIMTHFVFATILGTLINIALAVLFGDLETGLMLDGKELFWYIGTAVTFFIGGTVFLVATKSVRQPINFVCESRSLGIISMAVAMAILFHCVSILSFPMPIFDMIYIAASLCAIAVFIIISIAFIRNYEVPKFVHVVPSIYSIVLLVWVFVRYSDTKPLPFNLLLFAAVAFLVFFFICYGKIMCDVNKKVMLRRIFPAGLTAAYFMLVTAIFDCAMPLLMPGGNLGLVTKRNYILGFLGFFAFFYVKKLYRGSNIKHTIERKGDNSYLLENSLFVTYVPSKETRDAMFKTTWKKKSRGDVSDSGFMINDESFDKKTENDNKE